MSERYEDADVRTVEALEKIKAILREYDLWAAMTVVSVERMHWLYHFEPSWSALSFNPQTGEARFRAKRADFATAEQHRQVVQLTTGAIISTKDAGAKQFGDCDKLHKMLKAQFEIEHNYSDPRFKEPSMTTDPKAQQEVPMVKLVGREPIAYGLRYTGANPYWLGCWNELSSAERAKRHQGRSEGDVEIIPLFDAPSAPAPRWCDYVETERAKVLAAPALTAGETPLTDAFIDALPPFKIPNARREDAIEMGKAVRDLILAWANHARTLELQLAAARADAIEECARVCERRAERRFEEHGYTEPDTNAGYYVGEWKELGDSLDEEDADCATAIRALAAPAAEGEGKR